jgi:hypothetical protein
MDPGVQPSISGTEGATAEAISLARSRPKRAAAAAAASSIQQSGAHRQIGEATRTTSRKVNEANDEDPNETLYNRDGTVWQPRPISKIIQDLLSPHQEPLPAEISVAVQPLTSLVDAASSNSHKKTISKVASSTSTTTSDQTKPPVVTETELVTVPVAESTSAKSNNNKQAPVTTETKSLPAVPGVDFNAPADSETEAVEVVQATSNKNNKKNNVPVNSQTEAAPGVELANPANSGSASTKSKKKNTAQKKNQAPISTETETEAAQGTRSYANTH